MNLRFTNIFGARQSVLIALGLLAGGVSARAATLNVPAHYATIQAAVTAAAAGDTVLVADGTYTGAGNHDIDFGGKDLTVKSAGGSAACIIDCQKLGRAFYFHSGETTASRVDGFTIRNGFPTASNVFYGGGIYAVNSNPTAANCLFLNNLVDNLHGYYDGDPIYAGAGGGMSGGTAINCVFTGNSAYEDGGGMFGGAAINCTFTNNRVSNEAGGMFGGTATNCVFTGNSAYGGGGMAEGTAINCVFTGNLAYLHGGGIYVGTAVNCLFTGNTADSGGGLAYTKVTNCTIVGNSASSAGGGMECYTDLIVNCIIWGNTAPGGPQIDEYYPGMGAPSVTYSDVQGGWTGAGNRNADPLFVNAAGNDFHLTAASPCIDAGTATALPSGVTLPTTDFDGKPRLLGSAPDMGAYEFGSAVFTITPNPMNFGVARPGQSKDLTLNVTFGAGVTGTYLAIDGGANPGDFQIVSQNCVGGTGNCSAVLRFTPAASGNHSATLTLKATLAGSAFTTTVPLTGADPQTPYLYLSGYNSNAVHRYNATTGAPAGTFATGLSGAHGLDFGPDGDLYVCSSLDNRIVRYDGGTGAFKSNFVSGGGLMYPEDLAFGPDGNLYVVSEGTNTVRRYNGATGAFMDTFAASGINGATSLKFMPGGDLLVSNSVDSSISRYKGATGAFLGAFVTAGSGGLNNPGGMTFGPDGNLYVASYFTSSVLRYNGTTGAFMDTFVKSGSGGLNTAQGLEFEADGNLYVASGVANAVLRYNGTTGAFIDAFVPAGSGGVSNPTFFKFFPSTPLRTVGGTVTLEGMSSAAQPLAFTFRPATGSVFTRAVTPDSAGGYTVIGIPAAAYTVSIKGVKWLRKNISVDASAANVTGASVTLLAGDANNDNSVDSSDFGILIAAFNSDSSLPGSGYDPAADFNCDGVVDSSDFGLLIGNYGRVGDL